MRFLKLALTGVAVILILAGFCHYQVKIEPRESPQVLASENTSLNLQPQMVKTAFLWYCESLSPFATANNTDEPIWTPNTNVRIIAVQINAHVMPVDEYVRIRGRQYNAPTTIYCVGSLSLQSQLSDDNLLFRSAAYVHWMDGIPYGELRHTEWCNFPSGYGMVLDAGQSLYLSVDVGNTTQENQGVGAWALVYYVELP